MTPADEGPGAWDVTTKTACITGATNGIGKETAAALAALGATVVLACRNLELAQQVAEEIRSCHPGSKVEVGPQLDLGDQRSVRAFAEQYKRSGRKLDILVNNAGANHHGAPWHTPEGVGGLCQVNYLGHYMLTRLLEGVLLASAPARVVNVSSVTHRFAPPPSPLATFLQRWKEGSYYGTTKLANCLFAYELQRRLGWAGIQSCAVDPGGVASNIWNSPNSWAAKPPTSWVVNNIYAPISDGATAVIHAATVPWGVDKKAAQRVNSKWAAQNRSCWPGGAAQRSSSSGNSGPGPSNGNSSTGAADGSSEAQDLRFYARGLFATPLVTSTRGVPGSGLLDKIRGAAWGAGALVSSLLDWPVRSLTAGRCQSRTVCVPSAPLTYDEALGKGLWEVSAAAAGLPVDPVLPKHLAKAKK